jgi:hypothetical protein
MMRIGSLMSSFPGRRFVPGVHRMTRAPVDGRLRYRLAATDLARDQGFDFMQIG